ncbi:MAG: hypothetical protein BGO41_03525 [Clostridiales bacterium 38-18]|nr:MAG: hypothetical protein BGO41_03525 [Clostridiales bacterium 38-18]
MILLSACLIGQGCRYDGKSKVVDWVLELSNTGQTIAVCPEVLGGLTIPRLPCEINGDRIYNQSGADMTSAFVIGAEKTKEIAQIVGARVAIFKANSPSCGNCKVYNGNFEGVLVDGKGLAVKALEEIGIVVFNENEALEFKQSSLNHKS